MRTKLLQTIFKYLPFSWKSKLVDFLLRLQGIEIKIAETPEELEEVFRLRFEVYKNEDYIDPKDYPDGRLTDEYDKHSVSFLAVKNNEYVGTVRLVKNSDLGFPTEHAFNILEFPPNFLQAKTACLSKFCVTKKYRGSLVSMGLLKKALKYSQEKGITYWLFDTTAKLANFFETITGVHLTPLPEGPIGSEQIKARAGIAKRYFERFTLHPYLLDIAKIRL